MSSDPRPPFSPEQREQRDSLRQTLTQRAKTLAPEGRPAQDLGEWQPSLSEKIKTLGFEGEAVRAFDLLPLVLVAWADGTIQTEERVTILDILRLRGLTNTPVYTMFEALLEEQPAPVYLDAALSVLRDLLAEWGDEGASVVDLCIEVAAAAGDAIGSPDPISSEEREAMNRIAEALGPGAHAELYRQLGQRQS